MHTIALIVGSLRQDSVNKKLAGAFEKIGGDIFNFKTVDISAIPLYNGDLEANYPAVAQRMKDAVASADGVIFVTPEYNRSIPGVLKNVLDWGSRPMDSNVWAGKPAAMAGSSIGAVGTAVAQSHLRGVLGYLGMRLTVQPELYFTDKPGLIEPDGSVKDERTAQYLRGFLTSFADWLNTLGK